MSYYCAHTPKNCSRGTLGLITISDLSVKLSPIGQLVAWFDGEEFQSPDESNCDFTCWQLLCPTQSLSSNSAPDNWILTELNAANGGIASLVKCLDHFQASYLFLYTLILVSCPHAWVCNWRQEGCPLYWTHWVRSLLWPVSCSKWRAQRLKAAVELRMWFAMMAHNVSSFWHWHYSALELFVTVCMGIHLTQLQTAKPHFIYLFSPHFQLVRE